MPQTQNGAPGESFAAGLLEKKGYRITARNFRCPAGEIDIIAEKDGFIAFVEVKTRSANSLYPPAEAVTASKRRRIVKAAWAYLLRSGSPLQPRFDVIAIVTADKNSFRVVSAEHIENAFGV